MRYVELLIQGIRGFTDKQRFPLDDNRSWLQVEDQVSGSILAHLLRSAFDQTYFNSIATDLEAAEPGAAGKFSLVFETETDRWRIVGNTQHKATVLAAWDPNTNQFEKRATAQAEIDALVPLQNLRQRLPTYLWSPFERPQSATADLDEDWSDPDAIRQKLESLQEERALMQHVNAMEDEIDVLRQKQFKLEDSIRKYDTVLEEHAEAAKRLNDTNAVEHVDKVLLRKAKDWKRHTRIVIDRENEFDDAIETLDLEIKALESTPVWFKDPVFLAICGVTLLGFVVPPIIKMYNLALIGFAGLLGGVPWIVWKTNKHLAILEQKRQKLTALRDDARNFSETERRHKEQLEQLVREVQVMDVGDLVPLIEQRLKLQKELEALDKKLEANNIRERREAAEQEIKQILNDVEQKEIQLQEMGTANLNIRSVDEQIAKLEAKLPQTTPAETGNGGPLQQFVATTAVMSDSVETFCTQVSGFVNKVLGQTFPDRNVNAVIAADGRISGYDPDFGLPEPGWETLVYAAATLGAARVASTQEVFPVVWDQSFADVDDATLARFAGVAARAAGPIQLLVISPRTAFADAFTEQRTAI